MKAWDVVDKSERVLTVSATQGISSQALMKSLSDDAKALLGGYFGTLGMPGKSTLKFGMKESRPTKRAQVALDELVEAGALSRRDFETGAVEYLVQINCSDFGKWIGRNRRKGKWSATEPISPPR
jgi:hypothetical protein